MLLAPALAAACAHAPPDPDAPRSAAVLAQHDAEPGAARGADAHAVQVQLDAARREVILLAGPFRVPAGHGGHDDEDRTPLLAFDWPVDGWIRGFRISVSDAGGRALPRDIMHHLLAYNFDRRQLIHPGVERLFGMGKETHDVVLPSSAGVPLAAGARLGIDAVWHNETGQDLEEVYLRIAMPYTPSKRKRIAFEGFPFHVDVNYSIDGSNEFDVPPGRTTRSVEFVMPLDGGLIGVGGHLHDHGVALRLEDAETERVLFALRAAPDRDGRLAVEQKVFRKWAKLRSSPLRLEAGRRYRLVAEYENPTGEIIVRGAMAHIAGLFAPDDPASWPPLDPDDPDVRLDVAILRGEAPRQGGGAGAHPHHHP
jgi:hypothetical protein